jgi:integrase
LRHLLPAFDAVEIGQLTTAMIRDFLAEKLRNDVPRNSVQSIQTALSTVLTDAVIDGVLPVNPAHGASRRLWPRAGTSLPKALRAEELETLLKAADLDQARWLGAFLRIDARSGLRLGEMLALSVVSIEPKIPALRVTQTYHGGGRFGPPKNGRARVVEISIQTADIVADRARASGVSWLFPGGHGLPLSLSGVDRAFNRAAARAHLPEHFTIHSLRHTYATQLLNAGAPVQWVRQQLGHASIQVTVDVYGSGLPARRPDLVGLLDVEPTRHAPRHGVILPFRRARLRSR